MPTATAGPEIERLIQLLARLPGLGPRSARRAALFLIKKREQIMAPLAVALQTALEKIEVCRQCGNIDSQNPCTVCTDMRRDPSIIVVVADVAVLFYSCSFGFLLLLPPLSPFLFLSSFLISLFCSFLNRP